MNVNYRILDSDEIKTDLFNYFNRYQEVNMCKRKIDNEWVIISDPFIDDWDIKDYQNICNELKELIKDGGIVYGAFINNQLKGFISLGGRLMGSSLEYLDLTNIYVSNDCRGQSLGKDLFALGIDWAKQHQAKKIYISSHSALESQYFYQSMGCNEAKEYNQKHVALEPYDCQLEFVIKYE